MTHEDLSSLKSWFRSFTESFFSGNADDQKNIVLKIEHTHNVCKDIVKIGKALSLNEKQLYIAETVALFHDVGRFPQYAKYRTFKDSISVNHGPFGAEILLKEKVLAALDPKEQETIIQSVKFHNAFSLPDLQNPDMLLFVRLIRDADKLDIWRVFIEYYEAPIEERASAVTLGLLDLPKYSESVLSCINEKRVASLSTLKTLNDFKLMQLSWIYDLNFAPTFALLEERNYIQRIASTLPLTDEIRSAAERLTDYVRLRQSNA